MFNFMINLSIIMKERALFFNNLRSFTLIATFFSLWFAVYFQDNVEDFFAYFLILSLGILHGANDIKLIEKTSKTVQKKRFYKILILYLLIISISIILFYFLPTIALFLFVIFSAYHFGEQHLNSKITQQTFISKMMFLVYGIVILSVLFYNNSFEVSRIIENITGIYFKKDFYLYSLSISSLSLIVLGFKIYFDGQLKAKIVEEIFYILVFFIVFYTASLLWAFAIYFIFWHSIPSLADQVYYLYGNNKKENFIKYLKSSFIYWFISIVGLSLLYWLFHAQDRLFLSIFFTLIASITFPHVWVMSKFNK